jgi:hypothetical protein
MDARSSFAIDGRATFTMVLSMDTKRSAMQHTARIAYLRLVVLVSAWLLMRSRVSARDPGCPRLLFDRSISGVDEPLG